MTKLIISTLAAAIALSSLSTAFAAPKKQNPQLHNAYYSYALGQTSATQPARNRIPELQYFIPHVGDDN